MPVGVDVLENSLEYRPWEGGRRSRDLSSSGRFVDFRRLKLHRPLATSRPLDARDAFEGSPGKFFRGVYLRPSRTPGVACTNQGGSDEEAHSGGVRHRDQSGPALSLAQTNINGPSGRPGGPGTTQPSDTTDREAPARPRPVRLRKATRRLATIGRRRRTRLRRSRTRLPASARAVSGTPSTGSAGCRRILAAWCSPGRRPVTGGSA